MTEHGHGAPSRATSPSAAPTRWCALVDDLSNWYVRRSRRRFWRTDPNAPRSDSLAAQATLLEVLQRVTLLLAPFCPFLTERLYHELFPSSDDGLGAPRRLATGDPARRNEALEASMAVARRLTSLGRAARAEAGVKVRQPLARALVFLAPGLAACRRRASSRTSSTSTTWSTAASSPTC